MLVRALRLMLQALGMDTGLYSIHSLHRGDAMATYRAGANNLDIKRYGIWSSDAFWTYIMATSPVARALAADTVVSANFHRHLSYFVTTCHLLVTMFAYLTLLT